MATADKPATATLSGREIALTRRKAMAQHGKPGANGLRAALAHGAERQPVDGGRIHDRQTASLLGETVDGACGCTNAAILAGTTTMIAPTPVGRALAQARGAALTQDGKSGLRRVEQATRIAAALPGPDWQGANATGASGRQMAMQHRKTRSLAGANGTSKAMPARPSGPVRPQPALTPTPILGHHDGMPSATSVTGTNYLPTDMYEKFHPTRPQNQSTKALPSSNKQDRGKVITGTLIGRPDPAILEPITRQPINGRSVTGGERGAGQAVTGSRYLSAEHFNAVHRSEATPPARRTGVMSTPGGQPVAGSAVGRARQVTGDEAGLSRAVTGSQYFNAKDFGYQPFRAPDRLDAQNAQNIQVLDRAVISATMVTGDRPGAGGATTTGDERGACIAITGVPYIGADNRAGSCPPPLDTADRDLGRRRSAGPDTVPAPTDFSIHSPARVAWDAAQGARTGDSVVTGTAYGVANRITGPGNKAGGLITGTPEFRHHEVSAAPHRDVAQGGQTRIGMAQRLSGEAHVHERVTGDAWHAKSRVSGTEGRSSVMRNPSRRGNPRGEIIEARMLRDAERPAPDAILVTGSSGNTGRGAVVTVSGGARA